MPLENKYSAQQIIDDIQRMPEFCGLTLKNDVGQYIADCMNRMQRYEVRLNKLLMHYEIIDQPLKIRIGPEVEFYNIAGEQSFRKRIHQLDRAEKESSQNPETSIAEVLAKDDSFMPKASQHVNLNTSFFTGLSHAKYVKVDREPADCLQISMETLYPDIGQSAKISNIAIFQHEIVSPPRSPYGLGLWLSVLGQRIIDKAQDFGLKRSEIITTFDNMNSSGLHFHISAIGKKEDRTVNIMQRDCFPQERGTRKRNPAELSQLGLNIAHTMNQFLKDYIYIFAPTNNAYDRFQDIHALGTSYIGFCSRRIPRNQGSAMFRGEGRETYRESDKNRMPDEGPLRIELRVPDVGCIGHPNKRFYQEQFMSPFDVMESVMYILCKGVEDWAESRERELKGDVAVTRTESALYEQRFELPRTAGYAATLLREAQKRGEGFLTKSRTEIITERGMRQQEINDLDRSPKFEPGQNIDRSNMLRP